MMILGIVVLAVLAFAFVALILAWWTWSDADGGLEYILAMIGIAAVWVLVFFRFSVKDVEISGSVTIIETPNAYVLEIPGYSESFNKKDHRKIEATDVKAFESFSLTGRHINYYFEVKN